MLVKLADNFILDLCFSFFQPKQCMEFPEASILVGLPTVSILVAHHCTALPTTGGFVRLSLLIQRPRCTPTVIAVKLSN